MNRRLPTTAGLVPDCGGLIEEVAVAVVPGCFTGDAQARGLLAALGSFAKTLPAEMSLVVLTSDRVHDRVARWLDDAELACRTGIVAAPLGDPGGPADFFLQDSFLVAAGNAQGEGRLLKPAADAPLDHAEWLGAARGLAVEAVALRLSGGNVLVGPDFMLIGQDSVDLTQALLAANGDNQSAFKRLAGLDERRLYVVGYGDGEPGRPSSSGSWSDPYRLRQYGGNIDRFVSVTGLRGTDGRPKIVVADAKLAGGGRAADFTAIPKMLDATASRLSLLGFEVFRNAVPFAPGNPRNALRPRLYNNVLVENEVRPGRKRPLVWLPHFADAEPWLAPFDSYNAGLWRGLGFEPVPSPGWTRPGTAMGALRSATKVLRRQRAPVVAS